MKKTIQATFEELKQDPEFTSVTLEDIVGNEYLDSPEPSDELIESIARFGILEPLHIIFDPELNQYYPFIGRRRVKAMRHLQDIGFKFGNDEPKDVKIFVYIYEDLTRADTLRLGFISDNVRSPNPLTDVAAVVTAASELGLNIHKPVDQKELATHFCTTVTSIRKLAKLSNVPDRINLALMTGEISKDVYNKIAKLKDDVIVEQIAEKLTKGEKVTSNDIDLAKSLIREEAQKEAVATAPVNFEFLSQQWISLKPEELENWLELLKARKYAQLREEITKALTS
jgi:hypothetical protein